MSRARTLAGTIRLLPRHVRWKYVLPVGLVVVALCLNGTARDTVLDVYEDAMFRAFPSAARAYAYGNRSFDAGHVAYYDIDRAERYFLLAQNLDETYPYVYHQLARINFLRNHLKQALTYIDYQIALFGGELPNSYYMKGLIEGYMGRYDDAVDDYATYISLQELPSWAAANDYAWVLLKAEQPQTALAVAEEALQIWPNNAWLLNSAAIAAYEIGDVEKAQNYIQRASEYVETITERQWLIAYPGNNPNTAADGMHALRSSIANNMHMILSAEEQEGL